MEKYEVSDATPITEMEGLCLENSVWSGNILVYNKTPYYVADGLRGLVTGTFYIENGVPIQLVNIPNSNQINLMYKIIKEHPDFSAFMVQRLWYELQKPKEKQSY